MAVTKKKSPAKKRVGKKSSQTKMFTQDTPTSDWRPTPINKLPSWEGEKIVSLDTETCDPHLKKLGMGAYREGSFMVGYSFAFKDGPSFYVPFNHESGGNLSMEHAINYLGDQAAAFKGEIAGMNLSYDLGYLDSVGITFPNVTFFRDVQVADPLIYELHDRYNLNSIAERHGLPGKDESVLEDRARELGLDPKADMWKLHGWNVGSYAARDAALPLEILEKQLVLIDQFKLQEVWDLESQVLPLLVKLRKRGILIDQDKLEQIERYSLDEESKALAEVHRLTGVKIELGDVWKAAVLDPAFAAVGIKLPRTSTGKPSMAKDIIFQYDHPMIHQINWARKVNKLRTTFASSIREHMTDGRIRCTYNQIARETETGDQRGARYGRLSATNPNMQQQPSKDEFARMWRSIYIPEPGQIWACPDYSQQEPRWTTHFAAVCKLEGAWEAAKMYQDDPNVDNHDMMSKLTGVVRDKAKPIYLGLCYGEGGAKLCRTIGLPTRWCLNIGAGYERRSYYFESQEECRQHAKMYTDVKKYAFECAGVEGQAILDKFNEKAPFIKLLAQKVQWKANKTGFIRTILGRRLNFKEKDDCSGYDFVYRALNRLIQGSSADQTKKAMLLLDRELPEFFMQLPVHDEIDGSVPEPAVAAKAGEIMAGAIKTIVPFKVDVELGPNWGELVDISKYKME